MTYACILFNWDYTFGGRDDSATHPAPVATVVVKARSRREAAARAYVRCVGSRRARFLREALQAPPSVIRHETSPRSIAPALARLPGLAGDCYCLDNMVEAWFITAEPTRRRTPTRRKLLASLQSPPMN